MRTETGPPSRFDDPVGTSHAIIDKISQFSKNTNPSIPSRVAQGSWVGD
jgi:hypothetical protein